MQSSVTIDPTANLDEVREDMADIVAGNSTASATVHGPDVACRRRTPKSAARSTEAVNLSQTRFPRKPPKIPAELAELVQEIGDQPRDPDGVRMED